MEVWASFAVAQQHPVRYIGIEAGLSNNSVTCIAQDKFGFIWAGTYYGLNRFDGYEFKIYRSVWDDNSSLVNNHIKAILASGNRVYIGTEKGLMFFDYADLKFHAVYFYGKTNQLQKIDFNINQLISNHNGGIYIANGTIGALQLPKNDTIAQPVVQGLSNKWSSVQAMAFDHSNKLWVIIDNIGLCRYEQQANKFVVVSTVLRAGNCLINDAHHDFWIGTNSGLYIYSTSTGKTSRFDVDEHKLSSENVSNLTLTQDNELWISTNGGGIDIWNPRLQRLSTILYGETANSLRSSVVTDVYEDAQNRKWVATLRGGINIIDNKKPPFHLYTHDILSSNSVINNFILSFCQDKSKNIWIGTDGGGLSNWNTATNTFKNYQHSSAAGSLSSNFVVSMATDYTGTLWVASFNGGIDAFNRTTGSFTHYPCYNTFLKRDEKTPWKLYEDSRHRLWAGCTWGGALYLFNRQKQKFEVFDQTLIDIHTLFEDDKGALWAGDYTRLIKIDTINKKHKYQFIGQPIRAITEDSKHHLLIGTDGGGLIFFDHDKNTLKRYTENDGLPSNAILNILVDNHDNLWCSTYNGLSKRSAATGRFSNYYASDGLQSNQFSYNAALKLFNGEMLFGGIKGFNKFHPDSIDTHSHRPALQITGFKVNNEPIESTPYAQHQPINNVHQITIPFDAATIAVSYTALEYSFPEKISYAYYLENWDHGWNFVGKLKSAYFSRLNDGVYLLKIKATDTEGRWTNQFLTIKIVVLPPWYRTWIAYLLYLIAIVALIYWYWQYRLGQTWLRYEVEIANLKVEQEKASNERKLSFFTNVSHEFRTPLTLIINPIKDLLRSNTGPVDELTSIHRNARRLLRLVDQLLLFRKAEAETQVLNLQRLNFSFLCREIFGSYTHQAKIKNIAYSISAGTDDIEIIGDREKIEIALFNLVSNAFKFTPDGGTINIRTREDQQNVFFEISDSGKGITADVGEKLFDKYYQVKDASSLKTGFGIGLFLVKSFVEAHNGTVTYNSIPGKGATFILSLPKALDDLNAYPDEASTTNNELIEELVEYEEARKQVEETTDAHLKLMISDRQSVLIIDDNQEIRTYINKIFADNYTVLEADNGKAGLEMIKKHLPDVIISDIVMPQLSGLELCNIIKNDTQLSHIPIILLTGESGADTRLQGIEGGAVDYITKPFDKDLLVARVKAIIRNKKELQSYFFSEVTLKGKNRNLSEEHKDFLYRCIQIIEETMLDAELEVNSFAQRLGMSYSNLYKRIKAITGMSINGFIRYVRLQKAAELLINTNCNVNEAAYRAGFNDVKYFREHFNKQFGMNPSEFIKRHRAAFQNSYVLNTNNKSS